MPLRLMIFIVSRLPLSSSRPAPPVRRRSFIPVRPVVLEAGRTADERLLPQQRPRFSHGNCFLNGIIFERIRRPTAATFRPAHDTAISAQDIVFSCRFNPHIMFLQVDTNEKIF
ncbi:MAG TPA: hypothetical protein IAC12_09510 [Candidatus Aphodovivens avistercoris]|nr:hypothetical protein [Candidatus Aphodovivens avistercoris]